MGRSNAAGQQASFAPVDQYRKQLGRLANKVEKKSYKEVHRRVAQRQDRTTGAKSGGILVALLFVVLTIAYLLIYLGLKYEDERLAAVVRALNKVIAEYGASFLALIAVGIVDVVIFAGFVAYNCRHCRH